MSLTKWNEALKIIATIEDFPEGRRRAAAWLKRYGVVNIPVGKKTYSLEHYNTDTDGYICSDYLMTAIAKEAIENP